ncbi:MAG TPA: response regulator transcription factor [Gaiellaceae bacterium]|jgi:DNA-binding NarL/FixJ family response regulator|nr:response regulator transcription factor [Gaiellaceae bacterium]
MTVDAIPPAASELDQPVRIFICAWIRLYREGLARVLEADRRVEVIGSAATVPDAIATLRGRTADVLIIDLERPEAVESLRLVRAAVANARVLGIAVPGIADEVLARAEAGIEGFLTRDASIDELVEAVVATHRGEVSCSPTIAAALLRHVGELAADRTEESVASLTARQREIVELIREGLSNKEIARRLAIELPTVKNHVHAILEKLELTSRGQVARAVGWY